MPAWTKRRYALDLSGRAEGAKARRDALKHASPVPAPPARSKPRHPASSDTEAERRPCDPRPVIAMR